MFDTKQAPPVPRPSKCRPALKSPLSFRFKLGHYEGALEDYARAIELNPSAKAYYDRASCKFRLGGLTAPRCQETRAHEIGRFHGDPNRSSTKRHLKRHLLPPQKG